MDITDNDVSSNSDNFPELFYGICQCCLAEDRLISMLQPILHKNVVEIYSEMLNKCFSIQVQSNDVNVESLYLICETCIGKLRCSFSFHLQVEKSQSWLNDLKNSEVLDETITEISPKLDSFKEDSDFGFIPPQSVIEHGRSKNEKLTMSNHDKLKCKILKEPKIIRRNISKKISHMFPEDDIKNMSKEEYHKLYNRIYTKEIVPFKLDKSAVSCHLCDETFQFHKDLINHMRVHYPNYICDLCGKLFVTKRYLNNHINRHKDDKIPCKICNKLLKKSTLSEHIRRHSGGIAKHKCSVCDECFVDFYKRVEHMEKVHDIVKPKYKCKLCPKVFGYSLGLSRHFRNFHCEEKNVVCKYCNKEFPCKKSLENHNKEHNKEIHFQCEVCLKNYSRKKSLNLHMKTHNDFDKLINNENVEIVNSQLMFCLN